MTKVYLCDHTYADTDKEECAWYVALSAAFGEAFCSDRTQGINTPPSKYCAYADPRAVLFVHSQGGEQLWRDRAGEAATACHVVLVRSGGGQRSEHNVKGNLHGCFWAPEEFEVVGNACGKREITEFLRQMADESVGQLKWELLQPAPTEDVLALRLLCEAWLLSHRPESRKPDGLTIKAPDSPKEWFAPFATTPSVAAAAAIASTVGEIARADARTFLEKIARLHAAMDSTVSVARLPNFAADVEKLITVLKSAAR